MVVDKQTKSVYNKDTPLGWGYYPGNEVYFFRETNF